MSPAHSNASDMAGIDKVVGRINRYWRASGVPRRERQDRLSEIRAHLEEAAAEGRQVSQVVGPDPIAFAQAWSHAGRQRPWLDTLLRFIGALALLSGTFILFDTFTLGLDDLAITTRGLGVVVAGSASILCWDLIRTNRHRLSEGSAALAGLGIFAMVTVVILVFAATNGWVSPHVPLPAVVLLFVLAVACSVTSWKGRHTSRTRDLA